MSILSIFYCLSHALALYSAQNMYNYKNYFPMPKLKHIIPPTIIILCLLALPLSLKVSKLSTFVAIWTISLPLIICSFSSYISVCKLLNRRMKNSYIATTIILITYALGLSVTGLIFPWLLSFSYFGIFLVLWLFLGLFGAAIIGSIAMAVWLTIIRKHSGS